MKIRNVTRREVEQAVRAVRNIYGGNIIAEYIEPKSKGAREGGRGTFQVKLGVESSKEPGARRSWQKRRIKAACWHAFGHFFDALPVGSFIDGNVGEPAREAGATWQDRNIGSMMEPLMFSKACECEAHGHAARRLSPVTSGSGPSWVSERVAPVAQGVR